jgi:hypothetical protein
VAAAGPQGGGKRAGAASDSRSCEECDHLCRRRHGSRHRHGGADSRGPVSRTQRRREPVGLRGIPVRRAGKDVQHESAGSGFGRNHHGDPQRGQDTRRCDRIGRDGRARRRPGCRRTRIEKSLPGGRAARSRNGSGDDDERYPRNTRSGLRPLAGAKLGKRQQPFARRTRCELSGHRSPARGMALRRRARCHTWRRPVPLPSHDDRRPRVSGCNGSTRGRPQPDRRVAEAPPQRPEHLEPGRVRRGGPRENPKPARPLRDEPHAIRSRPQQGQRRGALAHGNDREGDRDPRAQSQGLRAARRRWPHRPCTPPGQRAPCARRYDRDVGRRAHRPGEDERERHTHRRHRGPRTRAFDLRLSHPGKPDPRQSAGERRTG